MNIDLLNTTLEVTEDPGLDMIDPRLLDITSLVENGEYEEAATQAEQILEEGAYDIRITGFFLYGVFLERGLGVGIGQAGGHREVGRRQRAEVVAQRQFEAGGMHRAAVKLVGGAFAAAGREVGPEEVGVVVEEEDALCVEQAGAVARA